MDMKQLFGRNVRKFRELKGWSQEELADRSGLHRTYISGIERGVRNPTIEIVGEIASAFNVAPLHLLEDEEQK
jgi:transcriptional regulator with XRE-family HTH domain